jgi:hypothetical protein
MSDLYQYPQSQASVASPSGRFTHYWFQFFDSLVKKLNSVSAGGFTGTVPLAKLTGGGVNGSLTFTNGILTARVNPT